MADEFDLAVLGGGTGGYTAAIRASQLGLHTVIVEEAKLGGTCLHLGCIPTKALLESSHLYHLVSRRGEEFGVIAAAVGHDYARIAARRDSIVAQLHRGVQGLMKKNRIEVIEGPGEVVERGVLEVNGRRVAAPNLIVATGSLPRELPGAPFDGRRVVSSDHAVTAAELPESIAIIGAGAVGVEFATFFNQMGSKVTLIEAFDRLVPLEDTDISRELLDQFQRRGIDCRLEARVQGVRVSKRGVSVDLGDDTVSAERVLIAVGRSPRSGGIGLDRIGVELAANGFVKVDEWMRTNVPGVHAIGDVAGGYLLAHAAAHEGIVAAEDIADQRVVPMDQELVTRCTYSQPEIASVGITEAQAGERGIEVRSGRFPFAANGRALIHGEPGGFAKVIRDAQTGQLLGAHVIGTQATELIAEAALTRLFQGDAWELGRNIHPHPTLSEAIGEAALAADSAPINF
ncbi:MAG: dihydrolipoyl dehydrogenase [Candidatus Dormibacteraceae bacterium]